jgi:starch-binding outer membrane protein, SusD/RagB family
MKLINLNKYITSTAMVMLLGLVACEKKLDKTNTSYPDLAGYFKNSEELLRGTNSIYSIYHGGQLVGREWYFIEDLRSDDVSAGGGQLEVPRAQILNGNTTPDNSVMNSVWNGWYTVIHRANTVIANGPQVTDNTSLRDRCIAEAKFFRALAYFELVYKWGPVPVYLQPVTAANQFQPRIPETEIYDQIVKDLKDAIAVLPLLYGLDDRGRPTKGAANAVLGRVYLQKGEYDNAKAALLEVVNSKQYTINAPYIDNFLEETEFGAESIFEAVYFQNIPNQFNWAGTGDDPSQSQGTVRNQEYSPIAWRNLIPSNKYLEEFENTARGAAKTDPRFKMSVYETGDQFNNGQSTLTDGNQNGNASVVFGVTRKISWRKFMIIYKHPIADRMGGGNNQRVIRYAEVLLMLAEIENELGNFGAAVGYLNQVRDRPGVEMPRYPTAQYPTGNKAEITRAIMHEKTVEMGGEEIRNRDIIRWRKKGYFTTDPISYFRPNRDELLPIPQAEIDNNPELGKRGISNQNKGY